MKKFVSLFLCVAMLMSLAACESDSKSSSKKKNKKKSDDDIISTIDSKAEETTVTSSIEETSETSETEETISEVTDPLPSETTTEVEWREELTEDERKAYADYLNTNGYYLRYYYWQFDSVDDGWGEYMPAGDMPVIFCEDINRDNKKEMIMMIVPEYKGDVAYLRILGIDDDGVVNKLAEEPVDALMLEDTEYIVYMTEGNVLCYDLKYINEGPEERIVLYENGQMTYLCTKSSYTDEDGSLVTAYFDSSYNEITEDEFNAIKEEYCNLKSCSIIFYNKNSQDTVEELSSNYNVGVLGMTLPEAKYKLTVNTDQDEGYLPFYDAVVMTFSSGAGGWGTDIVLNPDGTFTCQYHDSNLGESGDGYNATVYLSECQGSFKDIELQEDGTYKMKLEYYAMNTVTGSETIEDEVRYVYTQPYGIDGTEFILYLPNSDASSMPNNDYWYWYTGSLGDNLTGYVLHNVDGELDFIE